MAVLRPLLYRKRLIPNETVLLANDCILQLDSSVIVTSWNAIHKKPSLCRGLSCYYLKEGFKISKFYRTETEFRCWYCDIIETSYLPGENAYIFTDLLADVIIEPGGAVKVVDLDELAEARQQELITKEQLLCALKQLNRLLNIIYAGNLEQLTKPIILQEQQSPFRPNILA